MIVVYMDPLGKSPVSGLRAEGSQDPIDCPECPAWASHDGSGVLQRRRRRITGAYRRLGASTVGALITN